MKLIKQQALLLALGVAGSMTAFAENNTDHKYEAYVGAARHFIDGKRGIDNDTGINLGLGYVVNENWTIEGVVNAFEADTEIGGIDVDGRHYRLDALYNLARDGAWQPFLVGGIGDQSFDVSGGDENRETAVNFGGGAKYFLSDKWQLRGDLRAVHSMDEEATDYALGLGVAYLMGASSAPAKLDSDNDTVADGVDQCPNTPSGVAVDASGCALDSDKDGVKDYGDLCPDTPMGTAVNDEGCAKKIAKTVSIEMDVKFDTDSSVVKTQYMGEIQDVAEFMKKYSSANVELAGHTDATASDAYNQALSERRAKSVATVLVQTFDIENNRVTSRGYGEQSPVAENSTKEGRAANRRVVAEINTQTEG